MRAKFLAVPLFALGLLVQPAEADVVQLPLNGSVPLVSSGGFFTVGIYRHSNFRVSDIRSEQFRPIYICTGSDPGKL